jgi:hypothetical protein
LAKKEGLKKCVFFFLLSEHDFFGIKLWNR